MKGIPRGQLVQIRLDQRNVDASLHAIGRGLAAMYEGLSAQSTGQRLAAAVERIEGKGPGSRSAVPAR